MTLLSVLFAAGVTYSNCVSYACYPVGSSVGSVWSSSSPMGGVRLNSISLPYQSDTVNYIQKVILDSDIIIYGQKSPPYSSLGFNLTSMQTMYINFGVYSTSTQLLGIPISIPSNALTGDTGSGSPIYLYNSDYKIKLFSEIPSLSNKISLQLPADDNGLTQFNALFANPGTLPNNTPTWRATIDGTYHPLSRIMSIVTTYGRVGVFYPICFNNNNYYTPNMAFAQVSVSTTSNSLYGGEGLTFTYPMPFNLNCNGYLVGIGLAVAPCSDQSCSSSTIPTYDTMSKYTLLFAMINGTNPKYINTNPKISKLTITYGSGQASLTLL